MTIHESFRTPGLIPATRSLRDLRDPGLVCLSIAVFEGLLVGVAFVAVALVYHVFFLDTPADGFSIPLYLTYAGIVGSLYAVFSALAVARFLRGERRRDTTLPFSFFCWTAAFATTVTVAFLFGVISELSRVSLTTSYVLGIPLVICTRSLVLDALGRRIAGGALHFQKIAVVGHRLDVLAFLLQADLWQHGHSLVSTLYLEDAFEGAAVNQDVIAEFASSAVRFDARYVVIAGDIARMGDFDALIAELKRFSLNVVLAPSAAQKRINFLDVVPIGPSNTLRILRQPLNGPSIIFKRALDLFGASLGLILLSPLLLLTAALIRLDSRGPAIYTQERRGFNGRSFTIFKFRTMTVMEPGRAMRQAERADLRVTRIGRFLRASSIDELPQLLNVLRGDMSLVGPRPHAIVHDDALNIQLADYAHRRRIKPGITGWAQVNGYRGATSALAQMQGRIRYDLYYIDNYSIFFDLWVLLLTVFSPKTRQNAY